MKLWCHGVSSVCATAIYHENVEHLNCPTADKIYREADFILQQDLAPTHKPKVPKHSFNGNDIKVFNGAQIHIT